MTEMLKKFLSFMNLTVSTIYFKLISLCFLLAVQMCLETFNIYWFVPSEERRLIFVWNTENPFAFIPVNGMKWLSIH